jgi:hypothetical protein
MSTSGGFVNEREMTSEMAAVRGQLQIMQETPKEDRVKWIEDEVEEPERWDGLE